MNEKLHPRSSNPSLWSPFGLRARFLGLALLALLPALPALATSYVPMSDPSLTDRAEAIALVSVESSGPSPARGEIATDYLVQVERVVKGYIGGSSIVLRVPGGIRADGVGLKIWGAPEFEAGEKALVFLVANPDGSFGIEGLMLGAFHLRSAGGVTVALRDLTEAHPVALTAGAAGASSAKAVADEPLRDVERFVEWIADRDLGVERRADYALSAQSGLGQVFEKAARIIASDGKSPRWFQFDSGQSAVWYNHSAGLPGLTPDATSAAFRSAVEAWTNDPTSQILYTYGGTTGATGGFRGADRVNAILFNDPRGDVPGSFDCAAGGVLALGGPYFYNTTRADQHEIFEADVVIQDGTQCFFQDNPAGAAEVFAHELGHTLGFNHSGDREAIMYSKAKNDGRGPRLGTDDRIGASQVYGDGSYQGESPNPPTPPPANTSSSIELKGKAASKTTVRLDWKSTLDAPTSFEVGIVKPDGSFQRLAMAKGTARNIVVKGLAANTTYVFRISGLRSGAAGVDSNSVTVQTKK